MNPLNNDSLNQAVAAIRTDLMTLGDLDVQRRTSHFFKEEILSYGVKTADVRRIAAQTWPLLKKYSRMDIYDACEELLRSGYTEEAAIVACWLPRMVDRFEPADLTIFRRWIDLFIDNWAKCDSLCNHTIGDFILKYPAMIGELAEWAHSPNRWLRRAAVVSLIIPARRGFFLSRILILTESLLADPDDMVRKGCGWLLKEASRQHQNAVLDFVLCHRATMSRTTLRYAIEKMPPAMRQSAMRRD